MLSLWIGVATIHHKAWYLQSPVSTIKQEVDFPDKKILIKQYGSTGQYIQGVIRFEQGGLYCLVRECNTFLSLCVKSSQVWNYVQIKLLKFDKLDWLCLSIQEHIWIIVLAHLWKTKKSLCYTVGCLPAEACGYGQVSVSFSAYLRVMLCQYIANTCNLLSARFWMQPPTAGTDLCFMV